MLGFLGFKLKHEYADMAGWSNGKTLLWINAGRRRGKKHKHRKGDIGFHHYAFELSSRKDVDALGAFLEKNRMKVLDPPGEYYDSSYYAVYFADPDGMKLEAMVYKPAPESARAEEDQTHVALVSRPSAERRSRTEQEPGSSARNAKRNKVCGRDPSCRSWVPGLARSPGTRERGQRARRVRSRGSQTNRWPSPYLRCQTA